MKFVAPQYGANNFTCPYCGVLAEQKWTDEVCGRNNIDGQYYFCKTISTANFVDKRRISVSTCNSCHRLHLWYEGKMILPRISNIPMPIDEMPEKVKEIYNEARDVFPNSAKAAAALLRLALQNLCIQLGGKGKNINDDIGELVRKGLPVEIQKALDIVRVVGNNAVHPGELNLEDNSENAADLFDIINIIVDNRIIQPKKINDFYNSLPKGALDGIEKRDHRKNS